MTRLKNFWSWLTGRESAATPKPTTNKSRTEDRFCPAPLPASVKPRRTARATMIAPPIDQVEDEPTTNLEI